MEQQRPASARARLLAAAHERFYADGIAATGIDRLVADAGVAKMSLYNNFSSKDELVAAWLEERDADWRRRLAAELERHTDPEDRLLAVFDAYEASAGREAFRGCGFVNAAAELADRAHPAFEVVRAHKHGVVAVLARLAAEAELARPDELAEQLFLLLEGAYVTAGIRDSLEPLDSARAAARRLIEGRRT